MEKFKRIILKFLLTVSLFIGTSVIGDRPARAQFAVTDLPQIGTNLSNTMTEVAQMLKQLGVAVDQLDWLDTVMDLAGQVQTVLQDVGLLQSMFNSLQYQVNALKSYGQMLTNMELEGFNVGMIQDLRYRLEYGYDTIKRMIEQGMKIMTDMGIPKADKIKMAEEYAKNIVVESKSRTEDIQDDINVLSNVTALNQFDNLLDGRPANEGAGNFGSTTFADLISDEYVETTTSSEEAFGTDSTEVKLTGKMGFRTVMLILGILLAFSLIGVTIRFMRGDVRSEAGFIRIFVVIVAAAVLFTVLHAVMRL